MVRTFKLEGARVLLVGDDATAATVISHEEMHQGCCPLRFARTLEEWAAQVRKRAYAMGATQER